MAFSQKLSLRAYSFSFKKWKGKNPEQTLLVLCQDLVQVKMRNFSPF